MSTAIGRIIRRGWLFLANLSLEKKLILVFVFLLSLPITYVSYLSARSTFNSVLQNATNNAGQMADNASDTIDRYVDDLKRYTALPLYNKDVQYYLGQEHTDWNKSESMGMFLSYLSHTKKDVVAVYLVDRYDHIFYDKNGNINDLSAENQLPGWKKLLSEAGGARPILEGRHPITVNGSSTMDVISVLRTINSASSLQYLGMIVLDIDIRLFQGIVEPVDRVTQGSSLIMDEQGQLVYASGAANSVQDRLIALMSAAKGQKEGHFESTIHGTRYLTVYYTSDQTGWTTSVTIPLSKILYKVQQNSRALMVTTLILLAIALFVATFFSHALTKPLKSMVRLMRKVQHGNLDVWISPKYNDEIGMLGSHFNRMILRVKDLLTEIKLTEKRKQTADMRALQSQINPHFIYNTLESIRMLAESNDDPRVAKLTYLLGNQMRYSIVRSGEPVTIRQELEHVRNYFDLLAIRFPAKFRLIMDVPEPYLGLSVLKLVFQPIVENSVFHGLERKPGLGTITITASREQDYVVFVIGDDGVGMDADTVQQLNRSLKHGDAGGAFGIGLHNVAERVRLHYGGSCGLEVESEPGHGTRVIVRIKEELPDEDQE
ncbi:two-component system sensor histidine kinase YesM [Paenibacillus rhizosphaerae]|uniref:histidine kinase n=1 Tax=Paenibacillus rhizosphaerae TaxID=297318 RepID=A0A839TP58_9BACL|nr:sensor histidine kinase [Paenibacillus rhizosphaerae]MBB3128744.1 two-component system sensor histidine kinase YesM [Paenibacillus rhizosphaerae]